MVFHLGNRGQRRLQALRDLRLRQSRRFAGLPEQHANLEVGIARFQTIRKRLIARLPSLDVALEITDCIFLCAR
jgi:hypothetical protein